jgi:hypothetical protein
MAENRTRYVINIDRAATKVHLNPIFFGDMWCNLDKEHSLSIGSKEYVEGNEAQAYLEGSKPLIYKGRVWKNISRCVNCSERCRQSINWDISR